VRNASLLAVVFAVVAAGLVIDQIAAPAADDEAPATGLRENQRVYVEHPSSEFHGAHGEVTDADVGRGRYAMVLLDDSTSDRRIEQSWLRPERQVVLFHRTATAYDGATFDPAIEGPRRHLWIAQGFHSGMIAPFRAANPSIVSGLYKEAIYTDAENPRAATDPSNTGGVAYTEADTSHPEWFLKDASGNRITHIGHADYTLMDIGDPGYQAAWASNVIMQAKRDGWELVFADDLGLALYATSGTPVKYPDPTAWQGAVKSFLQAVHPKLAAAGLKLVANVVSGVTYPAVRKELLQWVDGTMEEGWMRPSVQRTAPLATAAWPKQLAEAQDAEKAGKLFLAELPAMSSDTQAVRYGLATYLLAAGGMSSFDVSGSPSHTTEQWFTEFDTALQLGPPAGSAARLENGIYRREFAAGTVLVNPTTASQTVDLGGRFSGSGLSGVSNVTLAATTGLVLLKDG
jgi:Hypothetical glycosyl hydrolase family 15